MSERPIDKLNYDTYLHVLNHFGILILFTMCDYTFQKWAKKTLTELHLTDSLGQSRSPVWAILRVNLGDCTHRSTPPCTKTASERNNDT